MGQRLKIFTEKELDGLHLAMLREIGVQIGVRAPTALSKKNLIKDILDIQKGAVDPVVPSGRGAPRKIQMDLDNWKEEYEEDCYDPLNPYRRVGGEKQAWSLKDHTADEFEAEGVLDVKPDGYGFIRVNFYESSQKDIYVSAQNIRRYNLRGGDKVRAHAKFSRESGNSAALQEVISVNDLSPEVFKHRAKFDDLVPCYPTRRLRLERKDEQELSLRLMDVFTPLGFGQRGLLVAPPRAGKTTLLKTLAQTIGDKYPDAKLFVLLIDERPEEVTDMQRSVNGEVCYSTFDERALHHTHVAEMVLSRAKRMVEAGRDVIILMDSITRLARAYNAVTESSGRTLAGGVDPAALEGAKKFFGAARNIEEGGSLTIISTALVETGNRMDDVIFEEFKGTGNMEIHLSRALADRRIFPAFDLVKSGTRKEELLLTEKETDVQYALRKILSERQDSLESLLSLMKKTQDNAEFLKKAEAWIRLYDKAQK